jgi:hypothetical protein
MTDIWSRTILGALVVAFVAWSGILWRTTGVVESGMHSVEVRIERMASELERVQVDYHQHESSPWHDAAGLELAKIRARIELGPLPEYP